MHYCQHTIKHGHYVCLLKGIAACYSKQSEGKHCMYNLCAKVLLIYAIIIHYKNRLIVSTIELFV